MNIIAILMVFYGVGAFAFLLFAFVHAELERREVYEQCFLAGDAKNPNWPVTFLLDSALALFWPVVILAKCLWSAIPFFYRITIGKAADIAEARIERTEDKEDREVLLRAVGSDKPDLSLVPYVITPAEREARKKLDELLSEEKRNSA